MAVQRLSRSNYKYPRTPASTDGKAGPLLGGCTDQGGWTTGKNGNSECYGIKVRGRRGRSRHVQMGAEQKKRKTREDLEAVGRALEARKTSFRMVFRRTRGMKDADCRSAGGQWLRNERGIFVKMLDWPRRGIEGPSLSQRSSLRQSQYFATAAAPRKSEAQHWQRSRGIPRVCQLSSISTSTDIAPKNWRQKLGWSWKPEARDWN